MSETWLADLQLPKTFFYMALSIIFTTYTRNGFKNFSVNKPLYYSTSLVLEKDKCSSFQNTLALKFDKAILKK